jgi:hypothetical protein
MENLQEFLSWAWARHHNPLSWYIRPLFVLPFCYFAYKKSKWGVGLTIVAVLSSMYWFPAPSETDPRAEAFLAMERQYVASPWTLSKVAMTALVPAWFVALGAAFWRRSWLVGLAVINGGALLKVVWSFHVAGSNAWSIVPPVTLGALIVNAVMVYAYRRARRRTMPEQPRGSTCL